MEAVAAAPAVSFDERGGLRERGNTYRHDIFRHDNIDDVGHDGFDAVAMRERLMVAVKSEAEQQLLQFASCRRGWLRAEWKARNPAGLASNDTSVLLPCRRHYCMEPWMGQISHSSTYTCTVHGLNSVSNASDFRSQIPNMTTTRFVRVLEPHKKRPRRKNRTQDEKAHDQAEARAKKQQGVVTYPTPESTPSVGTTSPQLQSQSQSQNQIPDQRLRRHAIPRIGRDSHLDAEKIDPFGALPIGLDAREQELLPFFSVACNFSVLPADLTKPELSFAYQWVIQAVHHPLLLTITCLHASVFQDLVFRGQALTPMSMKFMSNTLNNVQQALIKEPVPSAEVMSAVTTLVSISVRSIPSFSPLKTSNPRSDSS